MNVWRIKEIEDAMKILNESASGVTYFNDEYTRACKLGVEALARLKEQEEAA